MDSDTTCSNDRTNGRTRSWTLIGADHSFRMVGRRNSSGLRSKMSLGSEDDAMRGSNEISDEIKGKPSVNRQTSWRQSIFSRVVNPSFAVCMHSTSGHPCPQTARSDSSHIFRENTGTSKKVAKNKSFYKSLWRKIIFHQIGVIRIQRQAKLRKFGGLANVITSANSSYHQSMPCDEFPMRSVWIKLLNNPKKLLGKCDCRKIEEAVKVGIPADLRGQVWKFLLHNHDSVICGNAIEYDYSELLKKFTPFLNEILVDMHRTLPKHSYFSQNFGPGQISLFNVLKAYSCYDVEVGYCQGLSFVVAILLLHLDEEQAFDVFIKLMFHLKLRDQYKDDMETLQVEMYQLSRLVHDHYLDLHNHMEDHNIPAIYAAPWFLTLCASTFPLAFVARVFDFVFLTGSLEVVAKIALILLGEHKESVKQCNSFESINEFLRSTLPSMSLMQMEKIFNNVQKLNISKELLAYEVEYEVLKDESMPGFINHANNLKFVRQNGGTPENSPNNVKPSKSQQKVEKVNKILIRQNAELIDKLQETQKKMSSEDAGFKEVELKLKSAYDTINYYKCKINNLENRISTLELERTSLLTAFQRLSVHAPPPSNIDRSISGASTFQAISKKLTDPPTNRKSITSNAPMSIIRNGWMKRQPCCKSSDIDH